MKNNKIIYWALQFISWGFFCFLLAAAAIVQGVFNFETLLQVIKIYFLLIIFSHCIGRILVKFDWLDLKIKALFPRTIGVVIVTSIILSLINSLINHLFFNETKSSIPEYIINVLLYSLFFFMWTAIYYAYHLVHKSRVQEIYNLQLQARKTENELKNLRDQLNPHFLFNSLNSIRALIRIEPNTATAAISSLSNLLRKSLYIGSKNLHSIKDEEELVNEYLNLEKIRFEERLHFNINNTVKTNYFVPPFLLQGLVENAIKHGISKLPEGGEIDIIIKKEEDKLKYIVANSGELALNFEKGIGIENTIRRLDILYKDNAGFNIKNTNKKVEATIWINLNMLKDTLNGSSNN